MRWKRPKKFNLNQQIGDVREVIKFSFIPIRIDYNIIWLENYISYQRYEINSTGLGIGVSWVEKSKVLL